MAYVKLSHSLMRVVGRAGIVFILVTGALIVGALIVGSYYNYRTGHDSKNRLFSGGSFPDPPPDGFYQGNHFMGRGAKWRGKNFQAKTRSGINIFSDGERYHFKTSRAFGLRNKKVEVLQISYSGQGNPWWLQPIVDEIVQTSPSHYLGKVNLRVLGMTFTISYFELMQTKIAG